MDVESEASAAGPGVVLLDQDRPDEAEDRGAVEEDAPGQPSPPTNTTQEPGDTDHHVGHCHTPTHTSAIHRPRDRTSNKITKR